MDPGRTAVAERGSGRSMAVSLSPRADRLLARIRTVSVYSVAELLLLVLIAVQCARLFWTILTPLGPIGDYKALDRMRAAFGINMDHPGDTIIRVGIDAHDLGIGANRALTSGYRFAQERDGINCGWK